MTSWGLSLSPPLPETGPELDFRSAPNSFSGGLHSVIRGTHQGGYGWLRSAGYGQLAV